MATKLFTVGKNGKHGNQVGLDCLCTVATKLFTVGNNGEWAGHVARMGEERKVYKILVEKPEGKRPLGRPRRRWEDGIRMDLGRLAWIRLAQDRDRWRAVVSAVMNLRVLAPRS
jgi:hypothetical protein